MCSRAFLALCSRVCDMPQMKFFSGHFTVVSWKSSFRGRKIVPMGKALTCYWSGFSPWHSIYFPELCQEWSMIIKPEVSPKPCKVWYKNKSKEAREHFFVKQPVSQLGFEIIHLQGFMAKEVCSWLWFINFLGRFFFYLVLLWDYQAVSRGDHMGFRGSNLGWPHMRQVPFPYTIS